MAPPARRRARGARTWTLLGVLAVVLLLALLSLLVVALIVGSTGVVGFLVGTVLATLPAVVVVAAFLWVDRWEPEPRGLLAFLFAWGAIVAALAAALLNSIGMEVLAAAQGEAGASAGTAVLVAPVVEEVSKGLGILAIVLLRRREFDGVVDGVVCAGMVGIGFAFTENILYFGRAFLSGTEMGEGGGLFAAGVVFLLRGVLSPFAHPMFTTATGIGLGVAATTSRPLVRVLAPLVGLVVAVALHATWNASAVGGFGAFVAGYAFFMVPLFLVGVALVVWLRTREGRLIARVLPAYAQAGWIPPYDVAMVATMAGRRRARAWAKAWYGPVGERAMTAYQGVATELAFLRDRAARGVHVPEFQARERSLLLELAQHRLAFAGEHRFPG